MLPDEITLTVQELEDLKDEIKFRTTMTMDMKYLKGKIKKINDIEDCVTSLEIHRNIHWVLIILMVSGIVGLAFWRFRIGS